MTFTREKRFYPYFSQKDGRFKTQIVTYTLYFNGDALIDIRNEYNHSVERVSEVWDFFSDKYKS